MNIKSLVIVLVSLMAYSGFSQSKNDVIITVGNTPVKVSEFERVYKKNLDLVQDDTQKTVDGYLDLFIDYKLKVKEAYAQELDKDLSYINEFSKYEDQLSRNYLYEDKVTADLAKQAFERSKYEIDASHILVRTSFDDIPQDTLQAYNKISKALNKAKAGEDFAALAGEFSEEPGAAERGGGLGYFSTFTMVHQFEDAAFETPVGEVSDIVRTQFGYHIIKVNDKRQTAPDVIVSHIMITDNEGGSERTFNPEERIQEIYTLLQQGETFENLAKQYSEDKNSAKNGGKLRRFGKGDLRSKIFEAKAYELTTPGQVTTPFKSEFGWHIMRLEEVLVTLSFEEQKQSLEKKVAEGARSKIVIAAVNDKIKEKIGFSKNPKAMDFFQQFVTDSIVINKWDYNENDPQLEETLFTLGNTKKVLYKDFASYLKQRQNKRRLSKVKSRFITNAYDEFETEELKKYFRADLEATNEEYAAVVNEYRDGLLIFEVMRLNVWDKAKKDSLGLQDFYAKNKTNYQWEKRVEATVLSSSQQDMVSVASTMLQEGKTVDEIKKALNKNNKINIIISSGVMETNDVSLPENFDVKTGVSKLYKQNDNFIIVHVSKVISSSVKTLEDAKGKISSDFQTEVENQWIQSLRKKYPVVINKKALKKLKKRLE